MVFSVVRSIGCKLFLTEEGSTARRGAPLPLYTISDTGVLLLALTATLHASHAPDLCRCQNWYGIVRCSTLSYSQRGRQSNGTDDNQGRSTAHSLPLYNILPATMPTSIMNNRQHPCPRTSSTSLPKVAASPSRRCAMVWRLKSYSSAGCLASSASARGRSTARLSPITSTAALMLAICGAWMAHGDVSRMRCSAAVPVTGAVPVQGCY